MLKAAVDQFGACVHTKDYIVFGKLPLPPSLDTAKMLNRTDRTYLTLVNTSMMQHGYYRQHIADFLDLEHLPEQRIANPLQAHPLHAEQTADASSAKHESTSQAGKLAPAPAQTINPQPVNPPATTQSATQSATDAATAAGIPVGRSGRTGAYMVDDLLKHTDDTTETPQPAPNGQTQPNAADPKSANQKAASKDITGEATIEETASQHNPLNMTSLPKERILWVQGGRIGQLDSNVALRTVYLLYTHYVVCGDMQLAPQMRFSDHLTSTIKTHPFQVLRNVQLAETSGSSYFSDAPILATFDFLTVNLRSIGGAFELGSVTD